MLVRLFFVLFLAVVALTAIALIGCLSADDGHIRALPRAAWVLIILFVPLIGSIAWYAAGRPVTAAQRHGWRPGTGFPEAERPPRQVAPDDDAEFLRSLRARQQAEDRDLLRRWEEDLRRREEELRRQREERPDPDQ